MDYKYLTGEEKAANAKALIKQLELRHIELAVNATLNQAAADVDPKAAEEAKKFATQAKAVEDMIASLTTQFIPPAS